MEETFRRRCTLQGISVSGKRLGSGAYGTVFEAHYCGMLFAAKEIHSMLLEFSGPAHMRRYIGGTVAIKY